MRRRRKRYRSESSPNKKAVTFFVLTVLGVLILSVIIGLAIGKHLGKIAKELDRTPPENEIFSYETLNTSPISASFLNLEGHTTESVLQKVSELSNTSAVSIYLRGNSGTLLYKSNVFEGVHGNFGGIVDLTSLVEALHEKNIYVSAVCYVKAPSVTDTLALDSTLEFESSLLLEIIKSGVDDVIITGISADTPSLSAASRLFARVREKSEKQIILGASVNYKTMLSESGAYAAETLSSFADFLAIDMAACKSDGYSYTSLINRLKFIFEQYPIRALIDCSSDDDRAQAVNELNSLGIYNIQAYKASVSSGTSAVG